MPYLSTLEVCSRRGAIQIHVYLYLTCLFTGRPADRPSVHCLSINIYSAWRDISVIRNLAHIFIINVKNLSVYNSVRASYVTPLKQQKSLCLTPWSTKVKMCPYKTSCRVHQFCSTCDTVGCTPNLNCNYWRLAASLFMLHVAAMVSYVSHSSLPVQMIAWKHSSLKWPVIRPGDIELHRWFLFCY